MITDSSPVKGTGGDSVIRLGELVVILDLFRQGMTVSAISRQLGVDRKTVRKYLERGLETPTYGPRLPRPRLLDRFIPYLHERVTAYPGLSGRRLLRELRERGYEGSSLLCLISEENSYVRLIG